MDNSEQKAGARIRLLQVYKILCEQTDEEHPMSAAKIIDLLAYMGIAADRRAIYSDIDALTKFGLDIIKTYMPAQGYFLAEREFELPEVRLLADAVLSAPFITPKKSRVLMNKLRTLASNYQWLDIERQASLGSRIKNTNEEVFYNIDELHTAINQKRRVDLEYFRRRIENSKITQHKREFKGISPYGLTWHEDHYYLICNNPKYNNLMHLRVDRIRSVTVLDEGIRPVREVSRYTYELDVADYVKKSFSMFGGDLKNIRIRCKNELIEQVYDRFRDDINFFHCGETHFTFAVTAMISDGLVSWILKFDGAEVLAPEELREAMIEKVKKLSSIYKI